MATAMPAGGNVGFNCSNAARFKRQRSKVAQDARDGTAPVRPAYRLRRIRSFAC